MFKPLSPPSPRRLRDEGIVFLSGWPTALVKLNATYTQMEVGFRGSLSDGIPGLSNKIPGEQEKALGKQVVSVDGAGVSPRRTRGSASLPCVLVADDVRRLPANTESGIPNDESN